MRGFKTFCLLPLCWAISSGRAFADPVNFIALRTMLEPRGQEIAFRTEIPYALAFPSIENGERVAFATNYFDANFLVENTGSPCKIAVEETSSDGMNTVFRGHFSCARDVKRIEDLRIWSALFLDLFADVNHFVTFPQLRETREALLTRKSPVFSGADFRSTAKASQEASQVGFFAILMQFVGLGIPHILFGFDHVLFILAIHSIVRNLRDIVVVVTSFTIAHSLTLILAGLGLITLTSRVVEPLIAFSIAYTAFRNIMIQRQGKEEEEILKERWISAFGFGLVHGMGFAGALAEIKIPGAYFIPALLSFNVGVELGQFIIIAIFVSLLRLLKRYVWLTETVYGLSGAIALISSVWVVQRVLLW